MSIRDILKGGCKIPETQLLPTGKLHYLDFKFSLWPPKTKQVIIKKRYGQDKENNRSTR